MSSPRSSPRPVISCTCSIMKECSHCPYRITIIPSLLLSSLLSMCIHPAACSTPRRPSARVPVGGDHGLPGALKFANWKTPPETSAAAERGAPVPDALERAEIDAL